jgi:RNA recognition motif-containing protein
MPEDCQDCFVRVTNVPSTLSERELRRIFQRFGPLRKCAISRAGTDDGAGFGFVTFEDRGDAEESINELNGHRVGDRRLRVDWAYPRAHQA